MPSTERLARRFDVVGVDISAAQLGLARGNVPRATFVQADMASLELAPESVDGVVALYSISHVPRAEHGLLFRRIAGWLRPGGILVASLGSGAVPDSTDDWLGVPMFFSSHDAETNRRLLHAAGFELLVDEVVEMQEPEGPTAFLWVVAVRA